MMRNERDVQVSDTTMLINGPKFEHKKLLISNF